MLTGIYRTVGDVGRRLLSALPELLVVPARAGTGSAVWALVDEELDVDLPGQQVVLDRLLDLLPARALRTWLAGPEAWYRALGGPVAGAALRALHTGPARPWTVSGSPRWRGCPAPRPPAGSPRWSVTRHWPT
ncbi:cupin domain-containing protein [Streptomyces nogalater]